MKQDDIEKLDACLGGWSVYIQPKASRENLSKSAHPATTLKVGERILLNHLSKKSIHTSSLNEHMLCIFYEYLYDLSLAS